MTAQEPARPVQALPTINDETLTAEVVERFAFDSEIPESTISVRTYEGVVSLAGTTRELLAKQRAERIAETVRGVRSVVNRIEVESPVRRSETELAREVEDALDSDPATGAYDVDATVEGGIVTLTGTVGSWGGRNLSEHVAAGVPGVKAIANRIEVSYETDRPDAEIESEIEARLAWDVLVDDGLVDVAVDDGRVTLSGVVGSAAERERAYYEAWVAGVTDVAYSDLNVQESARDEGMRVRPLDLSAAEVRSAVEDALFYDPRVLAADVTVEVDRGTVTLRGNVDNLAAARAAARDARNTVGVQRVVNRLEVRAAARADDEIRRTILRRLENDPFIEARGLEVTVGEGVVRLHGLVASSFERAHADQVVSRVAGVERVQNDLMVTDELPPLVYDPFVDSFHPEDFPWYEVEVTSETPPDEALEEDVREQLFWNPFIDHDEVTVMVSGGVVVLAGNVDSWAEKLHATNAAYQAGALRVDNELRVPDHWEPIG